jgi:hypothetical protein
MNSLTVRNIEASKNLLKIEFECEGPIRKFFSKNTFYVEYNTPVEGTPEAILVIPFLATACPVAWAVGAEIRVQEVDKVFADSLENIKRVFQRFYPRLKFSGILRANNTVELHYVDRPRSMALFSGGVDSVATYIRHQAENPIVVSIHGADIDLSNTAAWDTAIEYVATFSRRNGAELRVVRSNFRSILDKLMLSSYSEDIGGDWWTRIMHGLALLGLCAPLTYTDHIGKLYIASSYNKEFRKPWASLPEIDNKVKWNGTTVTHDGYELSRQDKIEIVAKFITDCDHTLRVRSCLDPRNGENCNVCEKCSRTIVGLELAGIDPSEHGFNVKTDTFQNISENLTGGKWSFGDDEMYMWSDLKRHADFNRSLSHQEATLFINWLLKTDLNKIKSKRKRRTTALLWKIIAPVLKNTPYEFYKIPRNIYRLLERPLQRVIFQ